MPHTAMLAPLLLCVALCSAAKSSFGDEDTANSVEPDFFANGAVTVNQEKKTIRLKVSTHDHKVKGRDEYYMGVLYRKPYLDHTFEVHGVKQKDLDAARLAKSMDETPPPVRRVVRSANRIMFVPKLLRGKEKQWKIDMYCQVTISGDQWFHATQDMKMKKVDKGNDRFLELKLVT